MTHIPEEIITEIILQLPFESIVAFKLVSKQWLNLIKSPKFFSRYNGKPPALFVNENHIYCVLLVKNNKKITSSSNFHPLITVCRLPIKPTEKIRALPLTIAVNWTICSETENRFSFVFHNLFNQSSVTIVESDTDKSMCICHGHGYDPYDDDIKLFVVSRRYNLKNYRIYSLRNRAWKHFNGFPYKDYLWNETTYSASRPKAFSFNGVLHWAVSAKNRNQPVIVTYDLHTCKFGEMSAPDDSNSYRLRKLSLLGGKLCCWVLIGELFELWMMNEYGVRDSWMKLCSIHYSWFRSDRFYSKIEPTMMYESEDGGKCIWLVNYHYGSVYWYDIGKDKVQFIWKSVWLKTRVIGGRKGKVMNVAWRQ